MSAVSRNLPQELRERAKFLESRSFAVLSGCLENEAAEVIETVDAELTAARQRIEQLTADLTDAKELHEGFRAFADDCFRLAAETEAKLTADLERARETTVAAIASASKAAGVVNAARKACDTSDGPIHHAFNIVALQESIAALDSAPLPKCPRCEYLEGLVRKATRHLTEQLVAEFDAELKGSQP